MSSSIEEQTAEVDPKALDTLFRHARSQNGWTSKSVEPGLLERVFELAILGPTSMNCCPMRVVFVQDSKRKEEMLEAVNEGNREKIRTAPAVAILAYDLDFPELLPTLFPHRDVRHVFDGDSRLVQETAFRNATLQAAYLMIAARALGLDCGPISGFDRERIDQMFFEGKRIRTNFLCGIGYGDPARVFARLPRPDFDMVCRHE